ncbi:MAG: glycosyltransferase family 4 protein [Candidatus Desantisbacteria bacterium]
MVKNNGKPLKIIFLSQRFLFPMDTGGTIRTGKILEQLKKRFFLTVISNVEFSKDGQYVNKMFSLCDKFISVPWIETKRFTKEFYWKIFKKSFSRYPITVLNDYSPELEQAVLNELAIGEYDIAVCDFMQSTLNFRKVQNIPVLLCQHNVETIIAKRHLDESTDLFSKLFWWLQYKKMFYYEKKMLSRFDAVIAMSEEEKKRMKEWFGINNVYPVSPGVDTDYYFPMKNVEEKKQLVYVGTMDWLPNEDAMFYFIKEIFPLIKNKEPNIRLIIVGKNPSPKFQKFVQNFHDIEITGWVKDTRQYIAESAVFIVPIRIGGGTRIKIYEAMAMGKAIVSTSIGAEGLPLIHGEHILFADETEQFASQVVKLLRDPKERKHIGERACQYVYEHFRWEKVVEDFIKVCETFVKPTFLSSTE